MERKSTSSPSPRLSIGEREIRRPRVAMLKALVFGGVRGIPIWWWLIECSLGVFGAIPLWICRRDAKRIKIPVAGHH